VGKVYITNLSKFLPNKPISNDEMEDYLGLVNNKPSKTRRIILRNNKIKTRYYAIDKNGNSTHTNAELSVEAIKGLENESFCLSDMQLLSGGTTSPDLLLPSHTTVVQNILALNAIEIMSPAGSCNAGMQALKYCYLSVKSGETANAVSFGSEKLSTWMQSKNFKLESHSWNDLEEKPILAFEKDFLRWMLSDGAGAALLQNKPNVNALSLQIDWIDFRSYSNELDICMYAGGEIVEGKGIKPWRDFEPSEIMDRSLFSLRQDATLLGKHIVKKGGEYLSKVVAKRQLDINSIDYFLPHISSEYFRKYMFEDLEERGMNIPLDKWFTNLTRVGNVGAASIYLMLEELINSDRLKNGEKILLMVPESASFSYAFALLTVV